MMDEQKGRLSGDAGGSNGGIEVVGASPRSGQSDVLLLEGDPGSRVPRIDGKLPPPENYTGKSYRVKNAADLWDETSLPHKFIEFRDYLVRALNVSPEAVKRLEEIKSTDIYLFTRHLNLTYEDLAQAMARFFGLDYIDRVEPESIQVGVLPPAFCRIKRAVVITDTDGSDAVVISNPFIWSLSDLDLLHNAFKGQPYRLVMTHRQGIAPVFYGRLDPTIPADATSEVDVVEAEWTPASELLQSAYQKSAVDIVNALIADAVQRGASDLHIQPGKSHVSVRYRIDGRMRSVMPLPLSQLSAVIARMKIMCSMDIAESRRPQDGGCVVRVEGQEVELRASTLPSTQGEKTVLRFLGQSREFPGLDALGFEPDTLRDFRRLLAARQGMVLITGPTGSGKTTTLYSGLKHLNSEEVNILSVEDPVEIDMEGITQVQVNERAGRSFAMTLRSMLRQDPDIIMVGEIRDTETTEIACRAALTGHLVLSTLHTRHTLGTLIRLIDMGVPAYLAASSLNGVLAQRLVHLVCESCATTYDPPASLKKALEMQFGSLAGARFRKGTGCPKCQRTGTRGRTGVFELLMIDDDLRQLMVENVAPSIIRRHVMERGFRSLEEDAFRKVAQGLVPPEEIVNLGFDTAMTMEAVEVEAERPS